MNTRTSTRINIINPFSLVVMSRYIYIKIKYSYSYYNYNTGSNTSTKTTTAAAERQTKGVFPSVAI